MQWTRGNDVPVPVPGVAHNLRRVVMGVDAVGEAATEDQIEQMARQLQELQKENARLKRLVADQALDNQILREAARPNW